MKQELNPHYLSDLQVGDLLIVKNPDTRIKKNELVIFIGVREYTYRFHRVNGEGEWSITSDEDDFYKSSWLGNVLEKLGWTLLLRTF